MRCVSSVTESTGTKLRNASLSKYISLVFACCSGSTSLLLEFLDSIFLLDDLFGTLILVSSRNGDTMSVDDCGRDVDVRLTVLTLSIETRLFSLELGVIGLLPVVDKEDEDNAVGPAVAIDLGDEVRTSLLLLLSLNILVKPLLILEPRDVFL